MFFLLFTRASSHLSFLDSCLRESSVSSVLLSIPKHLRNADPASLNKLHGWCNFWLESFSNEPSASSVLVTLLVTAGVISPFMLWELPICDYKNRWVHYQTGLWLSILSTDCNNNACNNPCNNLNLQVLVL